MCFVSSSVSLPTVPALFWLNFIFPLVFPKLHSNSRASGEQSHPVLTLQKHICWPKKKPKKKKTSQENEYENEKSSPWRWGLRTGSMTEPRSFFFPVFFFFFAWAPWGNAEAVHSGVSPCFRESGCSYKRRWDRKLLDILCVHSGYHNIQLSFTLYYSDLINRAHRSDPPPQILQNRGLIYSPSFILLTYYESLTYFGYKALLLTLNQMSSLLWFNE